MRPIPKKLKEEMESDPFYKRCCITGEVLGRIEWHHNLIFAGRQVNEKFAILPITELIHDNIVYHKEKLDWIMLNRATDEQLKKYSKSEDLLAKRERLNNKHGLWQR